jgi:hypothetical protein
MSEESSSDEDRWHFQAATVGTHLTLVPKIDFQT